MKSSKEITIRYAPIFVRMYKRLDSNLKEEVKDKIAFLEDIVSHEKLQVHKLKGLENTYSFRVNYKIRIVFEYEQKDIVNLLYVGSHDEAYK